MMSRLLAVGLLMALLAALLAGVALPLWQRYEAQNEAIADARHRIATYRRIAAARDVLQQRQAAVERQQAGERLFLDGDTEAVAAAELQRIASREIANIRGRLISTQVLASVQDGGFRRVGIQVRMRAPLPAVLSLLESLYESRPALFIDAASLRQVVVRGPTRKGQPVETQLDFGFDLRGYMRGGA